MGRLRAAVYGRVSTDHDEQKKSLTDQGEMFFGFAEQNGMDIVRVYSEVGSGTSVADREQFTMMINDALLGLYDVILVKDISRFSRNVADFQNTLEKLKFRGVTVYFVNQGLNTKDTDIFILLMFATVGQTEALTTRKKTKDARRAQILAGAVPCNILGYDKHKETGAFTIEINEDEAKTVRRIFELYSTGMGAYEVCDQLETEGFKTKHGYNFTHQQIRRTIMSKIYIGIIENNKEETISGITHREIVYKNKSEWLEHQRPDLRIIDDETFYKCYNLALSRAQKHNEGQKKIKTGWQIPLSGKIKCSCGQSFIRFQNGRYTYFKCNSRLVKSLEPCGSTVTLREDDLYQEMRVYLLSLFKNKEQFYKIIKAKVLAKMQMNSGSTGTDEIKEQIAKLEAKKQRALDLYLEDGVKEARQQVSKFEKEINDLKAKLAQIQNNTSASESSIDNVINNMFYNIGEAINALTLRDLNGPEFNRLIDTIYVADDGHLEIKLALFNTPKPSRYKCDELQEGGSQELVRDTEVVLELDQGEIAELATSIANTTWTSFKNCRTRQLGSSLNDTISIII